MTSAAAFRGQPLLLLALLLLGWIVLRTAFWRSPLIEAQAPAMAASEPGSPVPSGIARRGIGESRPERSDAEERAPAVAGMDGSLQRPLNPALPDRAAWQRLPLNPTIGRVPASPFLPHSSGTPKTSSADAEPTPRSLEVQSQAPLSVARDGGIFSAPPPASRRASFAGPAGAAPVPAALAGDTRSASRSRWGAEAWLLLRQDSDAPVVTGTSAYGRSQAGAVLRYRLAPSSRHAPQTHLRGGAALDNPGNDLRESEVAAGLSARPIPRLPVRVAAEVRVSDTSTGTRLRPAVYAVTELPPAALPLGAQGELYVQGGYVHDEQFATAFIDGQARIDKPVARLGPAALIVGAAMWGGAQRQASRLDVGPSAGAAIGIGRVRARISADYRLRIAGESRPGSGPALTVTAGF